MRTEITYNGLINAIESHDKDKVKELLDAGVSLQERLSDDIYGEWGALYAAIEEVQYGGGEDIVKILLEYGANVNPHHIDGKNTPLHSAILGNYESLVRILLENCADPNVSMEEFGLPLSFCVKHGRTNIAKLLLQYGAYSRINDVSGYCGFSPLSIAASRCKVYDINLLIDYGASTFSPDEDGVPPINHIPTTCETPSPDLTVLYRLLDPKSPPKIKIGEENRHRYIIYNAKRIGRALASPEHTEEGYKYLYHGIDIIILIIYSATRGWLSDEVSERILSINNEYNGYSEDMVDHVWSVLGWVLLMDHYKESEKYFIFNYLSVSDWWFDYYHDLCKLTPDSYPFVIDKKLETMIFQLIEVRYRQFSSGSRFNTNTPLPQR